MALETCPRRRSFETIGESIGRGVEERGEEKGKNKKKKYAKGRGDNEIAIATRRRRVSDDNSICIKGEFEHRCTFSLDERSR